MCGNDPQLTGIAEIEVALDRRLIGAVLKLVVRLDHQPPTRDDGLDILLAKLAELLVEIFPVAVILLPRRILGAWRFRCHLLGEMLDQCSRTPFRAVNLSPDCQSTAAPGSNLFVDDDNATTRRRRFDLRARQCSDAPLDAFVDDERAPACLDRLVFAAADAVVDLAPTFAGQVFGLGDGDGQRLKTARHHEFVAGHWCPHSREDTHIHSRARALQSKNKRPKSTSYSSAPLTQSRTRLASMG